MSKKSTIIVLLLLLFCSSSFAQDSTTVTTVNFKPAVARAVVDDSSKQNCTTSPSFKVWLGDIVGNHLDYKNWKNVQCPTGYLPYGLQKLSNTIVGNGTLEVRYYCCKTVIKYD